MPTACRWLAAVATVVLAAACGSGDEHNPFPSSTSATAHDELREVLTRYRQSESFKVVYAGSSPELGEWSLTWYVKRPMSRTDLEYTEDGRRRTSISISRFVDQKEAVLRLLDDDLAFTYVCSSEGGKHCTRTADPWLALSAYGLDTSMAMLLGELEVEEPERRPEVTRSGQRRIAGQNSACFHVKDRYTQTDYCFNAAGVPLLIDEVEGVDEGNSWRAMKYTRSVSDRDFEPPYPMRDD